MKLNLTLVVIVFVLICAISCAPNDRKNKKLKDNKNKELKDNENKEPKDSKTKITREEKQFKRQLRSLSKLGCKPSKCKVPIKTLLNSTSTLHDLEHVYPQFVIIKKCKESCSYCKLEQDDLGIESRVCKAKKFKTKKILVKFFDPDTSEWKYEHVTTEEDKKCECMDKDDQWDHVS